MNHNIILFDEEKDCVYSDNGCCGLLKKQMCLYKRHCSFYCTAEQKCANTERYNEIMRAKPIKIQLFYADKYHGGIMSWALGD